MVGCDLHKIYDPSVEISVFVHILYVFNNFYSFIHRTT